MKKKFIQLDLFENQHQIELRKNQSKKLLQKMKDAGTNNNQMNTASNESLGVVYIRHKKPNRN